MPPQHRWHTEMGEGRLNRNPFLSVQKAGQPWMQTEAATWRDAVKYRYGSGGIKKKKDELHTFVISNRYDTTFN